KACELAYDESEAWLEELLDIIDTNQHLVHDFFKENFPQIKAPLIEGTYVQWIDFNALELKPEELKQFLQKEEEFFASDGYVFGKEGRGFIRVNIALKKYSIIEAFVCFDKALLK